MHTAFKYQKPKYATKLNLVALMDIFTILVFFLLLNSGEAEKLENAKFVQLPDSTASTQPHADLIVLIDGEAIWLGDEMIVSVKDAVKSKKSSIEPLSVALAGYRERKGDLNVYEEQNGMSLTIMGDHAVPFGLLQAVMATARLENFREISLAVNQIGGASPNISTPTEDAPTESATEQQVAANRTTTPDSSF